jgi:hypothetical protein
MSAPPRARPAPPPSITARDPSSNSVTSHLATCLKAMGATALADTVERCSTHFRVLACDSGHGIRWIPADRCRHRLCPRCARDEPLPTRVNRLQRWFARLRTIRPRAGPAARPSPPTGSRRKQCTRAGNTSRRLAPPHRPRAGSGGRSAHAGSRGRRPRNRASSVSHGCAMDGPVHNPATARRPRQRPAHDRDDGPDTRRAWNLGESPGSLLRRGCWTQVGCVSSGRRRPTREWEQKTGGPRR